MFVSTKKNNLTVIGFVSIFLLSACGISSTTESTTESIANTSESVSDLTSSVSSSSAGEDDVQEAMVIEYVTLNYTRLRTDMALGKGEHLEALATLLSVDEDKKSKFYAMTKEKFDQIFKSTDTSAEDVVDQLYNIIDQLDKEMSKTEI